MTILHLDTSILGDNSVSREVSAIITKRLAAGGERVVYRDLAAENPPHVTPATIPSSHPVSGMAGPLDAAGQAARQDSERMLAEFQEAGTVVIGAPMYNFTIPSTLKAWIDRIVVPGVTFQYGANGPEGLATGKRVIVAIARGGFYGPDTAAVSAEHAESYLRVVLGFIGIQPEFVLAEGIALGQESREKALKSAHEAVDRLEVGQAA